MRSLLVAGKKEPRPATIWNAPEFLNINAGTYTFGIYASTGGWNINWIKFTKI